MKLENNTVLLTGGASGIGLAMAQRFLAAGSEVIIVGRRREAVEPVARPWTQHTNSSPSCTCGSPT